MRKILLIAIVLVFLGGGFIILRSKKTSLSPTPGGLINQVKEVVTGQTSGNQNVESGLTLAISSPQDGATVNSPQLTVSGKTAPGAEVSVNDVDSRADASGNFAVKITLDEGENYIVVLANDASGKYAQKEFSVTYQPPQ